MSEETVEVPVDILKEACRPRGHELLFDYIPQKFSQAVRSTLDESLDSLGYGFQPEEIETILEDLDNAGVLKASARTKVKR